jgi:riboflavin kinase/FMN adenylyltransferase
MMNIGMRPTFDGQQRTAEIHLFDFSGDIYGLPLTVDLIDRLRDEQHFENAEALKQQMHEDAIRTKEILNIR